MVTIERQGLDAEKRMAAKRDKGFAVSARYDRRRARIVVALSTGVEIAFPPRLAEGLAAASADDLADIEVSPAGLGLHWPKLDADLYVPALLEGVTGSKRWMAAELGAAGGRAQSDAKAAAARENGRKGGRPRKAQEDDPPLLRPAKPKLSAAERKAVAKDAAMRAKPAALIRVAGGERPAKPAVPLRKSITAGYIVCLEDGRKFKSLKRHLMEQYGLSPEQYREKWGLSADYPMVAPVHAAKPKNHLSQRRKHRA
jgi:predicted transcriptional regulator